MAVSQRFAPFVRIHRRVFMGLDWTVTTTVERLAPEEGAFTLRLPLLPGEAVLTPGLQVGDEGVLVSMPSGESIVGWESALERVDRLRWAAAASEQAVGRAVGRRSSARPGTPSSPERPPSCQLRMPVACGSTSSCRGRARRSTSPSCGRRRAQVKRRGRHASRSLPASGSALRRARCNSPIAAAAAGVTTCELPQDAQVKRVVADDRLCRCVPPPACCR